MCEIVPRALGWAGKELCCLDRHLQERRWSKRSTCRSFQAPKAHPAFRDHPSQQPRWESIHQAQTRLLFELPIEAVAASWVTAFLALLLQRLCDHPRFIHGCSLTKAEKLRRTCTLSSFPQAAPAPSTVRQPWGCFPAQGQQWLWSAPHPSHGDHALQEVLL